MPERDALLDAVHDAAGCDDLGPPSWVEGLEVLLDALAGEARLTELGDLALTSQLTTFLANRARVHDFAVRHPEVRSAPVEAPLVVLGLPRTGTTLLSYLLDLDPRNRSLLRWEALDPVPPPAPDERRSGPRVEAARAAAAVLDDLNPGFRAMHHEEPDGPTECVTLLAQDVRSLLYSTLAVVPSYDAWLLEADHGPAYEWHRLVLQVLQSSAAGRWSLKTPHHCLAIDALLHQYPHARLVLTHRDPVTVVASTASLVRSLAGTFSDADHGATIAPHWTEVLGTCADRVVEHRERHGDAGWVDVAYDELVADPVGTVRGIYEGFAEELHPSVEAAIATYVAEHPRGEHGEHRYSPGDVGLDPATVRDRFAASIERFGELQG